MKKFFFWLALVLLGYSAGAQIVVSGDIADNDSVITVEPGTGINNVSYTVFARPFNVVISSGFACDCAYGGGKSLGSQQVLSVTGISCADGSTLTFYPPAGSGTNADGAWTSTPPVVTPTNSGPGSSATINMTNNTTFPEDFRIGIAGAGGTNLDYGDYTLMPGASQSVTVNQSQPFQWATTQAPLGGGSGTGDDGPGSPVWSAGSSGSSTDNTTSPVNTGTGPSTNLLTGVVTTNAPGSSATGITVGANSNLVNQGALNFDVQALISDADANRALEVSAINGLATGTNGTGTVSTNGSGVGSTNIAFGGTWGAGTNLPANVTNWFVAPAFTPVSPAISIPFTALNGVIPSGGSPFVDVTMDFVTEPVAGVNFWGYVIPIFRGFMLFLSTLGFAFGIFRTMRGLANGG